jgi:uncharacterized metal-binding protein YceD (DUF177 family)
MLRLQDLIIKIPVGPSASLVENYQLDDTFFKLFEGSLLDRGRLSVRVQLSKASQHIQLDFFIEGTVELSCDRTLELFDYPMAIHHTVHFKLGEKYQELDVDLYMLHKQASSISLAQHLYDFISLAIPMKKLHPRFSNEAEEADYLI